LLVLITAAAAALGRVAALKVLAVRVAVQTA